MTICHSHRKKDPFARINKNILYDKTISLKAKGILCIAFSRPDDWTFYKKELMSHSTDGEYSFDAGIDELENAGYLYRVKTKSKENGHFTGWEWHFFEDPISEEDFKKFLRNGGFPGVGVFRKSEKAGPTKNDLVNKNEKQQQQPDVAAVAAVPSDLLKDLDLPEKEKEWLLKTRSREAILHAIEYCKHVPPKTTLSQQMKWASDALPQIPISEEKIIQENKSYGEKFRYSKNNHGYVLEVFNSGIEIYHPSAMNRQVFRLEFTDKNFRIKLDEELKRKQFEIN